jgi:hypothetical protein
VTPSAARALVAAGYSTATSVALGDRAAIANETGLSTAEAESIVSRAITARAEVAALNQVPNLDAAGRAALEASGIRSVGDLARADPATISNALGSAALADRLRGIAGGLAGRVSRRGPG